MTDEEYFRKNYTDYCYGNKPLSPYWDFFQDGVEFGERQIEELENKIADIKANCDLAIEGRDIKIKELEQQIVELQGKYKQETLDLVLSNSSKRAELEQQIEKMKLCQNCKFEDNDYMEKPCCDCIRCLGDIKRNGTSDKWEIKEND